MALSDFVFRTLRVFMTDTSHMVKQISIDIGPEERDLEY